MKGVEVNEATETAMPATGVAVALASKVGGHGLGGANVAAAPLSRSMSLSNTIGAGAAPSGPRTAAPVATASQENRQRA